MGASPPQGSEKRPEEHHFGEDEPAHGPTVRRVNLVSILATFTLTHRLTEPLVKHASKPQQTEIKRVLTPLCPIDPLTGAQQDKKQANSRKKGVPRWAGHKIVRGRSPDC